MLRRPVDQLDHRHGVLQHLTLGLHEQRGKRAEDNDHKSRSVPQRANGGAFQQGTDKDYQHA